ncbi:stage III sporulation protein AE [Aciduricibacillus chroicocephali]|uniref:Stage III sporulation protein AE n=1 Tax=Aciduricibacillus chroicocephali TaxID=3054939 RepID=A0ABY9KRK9_9BACI|nr:stage III sporulation protein AE [Bacillaceae bacterium 44XB]
MRRSKQSIFLLILISLFFFHSPDLASAQSKEEPPEESFQKELAEQISLDGVQEYWDKLGSEYKGFLPELEKTSIKEFLLSKDAFSGKQIIKGLLSFLFQELVSNGKLLGMLLVLVMFSAMLQTMHSAFEQSTVSKIAYFVVYLVLLFIAMNSFYSAFDYTRQSIEMMGGFMTALLPLLLGIMASFGNLLSVSFFHPVIVFLIYASSLVISKFVLPLLFLSALILIISSLNERFRINHLASLMKTVALGTLGAFLALFLGAISIQGAASAVQDGVAMKTTKFIAGNFIPVVGRTFTDAADTIFAASLILKNGIGIIGAVLLLLIAFFPAIKILVIAIIYKIAAAVLQPIGDGPIIETLNTISKYMIHILACLLACAMMFFLSIVIIAAASNVTILMR